MNPRTIQPTAQLNAQKAAMLASMPSKYMPALFVLFSQPKRVIYARSS